jgi:hypothetical protein
VLLVAVIKIPDQIWTEEAREQKIARDNITSIYESLKFYHRVTDEYTKDPAELIRVVRSDSSLIKLQKVVNYTQELRTAIENYMAVPYIDALYDVSDNVNSILQDIEVNARYLRIDEDVLNEAENLKVQLADLNNDIEYEYYVRSTHYLDSLRQLRRDLSDFTLQTASSRASSLTDSLQPILGRIEIDKIRNVWSELEPRFSKFVRKVMYHEIAKTTSVHDRIDEFKEDITDALGKINELNINNNLQETEQFSNELAAMYQKFLKDFIITGRTAQYRLSPEDSMVLHLTEDNFYSPVNPEKQMEYIILIDPDSASVKVESPVLLDELKSRVDPILAEANDLDFLPHFQAYLDTVDSIMTKAAGIKRSLRKNTDIFIKNKELEEVTDKLKGVSEFEAFFNLKNFIENADTSRSYSDLELYLEDALNGIRIFKKMYDENFFPNIDTLHQDLIGHLTEYNEILAEVRRLPRGVTNFENQMSELNNIISRIKTAPAGVVEQKIIPMENDIAEVLEFAVEGDTETVFGVFKKKIVNFGYIHKDFKSWEEED